MSVWFTNERRDAFPVPPIPPNSAAGWGQSLRKVDLSRSQSAMQKGAVWSAVNLLASVTSNLPLNGFRGVGPDKQKINLPRWFGDLGGSGHGTEDWLYQVIVSGGLRGNAFGLIVDRDPVTGQPRLIDPLHPDDVRVQELPQPDGTIKVVWYVNGKQTDRSKIWTWRRYPHPGLILGLSPIAMHAVTLGLGLSAQNFGAQFFVDGAHPSAVLTNERVTNIDQKQAATVKERFLNAIRGTREPVVLGGGWKYQQIQIAPAESQFLETQKYTDSECARIYGPGMPEILGYESGGSFTYANIEQRSLDLLTYTFNPWLGAVERFLSRLLPQPQYVKFDRKALLQTDIKTRYEAHAIALENGWAVINEVRAVEDERPVEWGDKPYLPQKQSTPTNEKGVTP